MNSSPRLWILGFTVLLAALGAQGPAFAGLDLRIGACAPRGDSAIRLDCANPDSVVEIIGTFQVPDTVRGFVGIGITVDFETETDDLPPFWRLEPPAGCNRTGMTVTDAMPEPRCAGIVNVWGEQGSDAFSGIAAYGAEYQGYHRGRMIGAVVRPSSAPVDLVPGVDYYGFTLRLFTDNAAEAGGKCAGCQAPVRVIWSAVALGRVALEPGAKPPPDIVLTRSERGFQCVRLNGAKGACEALPPTPPARNPLDPDSR